MSRNYLQTKKAQLLIRYRFLCAAILILLSACGPLRQPVPPGEIPEKMPVTAAEEEIGHQVLQDLSEEYELDTDDARINRVRTLVDKLAMAIGAGAEPWHVYVFKSPEVKNAAATQGNHLFVWSGLIDEVKSDDELVTVLAHEMGHILAGHPTPSSGEQALRGVSSAGGAIASEIVAAQGGAVGIAADLAQLLVEASLNAILINPESQRQELEADVIGINLMAEAGFNPQTGLDFWKRIQDSPDFASGGALSFLSTHPSSKERIAHIEQALPQALDRYHRRGTRSPIVSAGAPGSKERWRVVEDTVQIRSEPSDGGDLIKTLKRGVEVVVINRNGRWLHISEPESGWVRGVGLTPI